MASRVAAVLALLVTFAASACTPDPQLYWHKVDGTQQDFNRDDDQCRRDTAVTSYDTNRTHNIYVPGGGTTTIPSASIDPDMYARCMVARGYSLREAVPTQAPWPTEPTKPLGEDPHLKDIPLCAWGEHWHSVRKQCVKIGSNLI